MVDARGRGASTWLPLALLLALAASGCDDGGADAPDGGTDAQVGADIGALDQGPAPDAAAADVGPGRDVAPPLDAGDAALAGDGAPPFDAAPTPDAAPDQGPPAEVQVTLATPDDPLPMLDQPLSGEETNALRMGFDWAATEPWPEVDPDGRPALFYALILVASEDDRRNLDLAEIHHWSLPLFPEERARWDGQVGVVAPVGDGYGSFEFAILAGAAFNVLREAALEGEVVFEVITRREPPPGYTHPDGSLRYDALLRGGFRYDPHVGIEAGRSPPPAIGFRVEPFIGEIIALVLALDRDARDAVEDAAGDIDHEFRDLVPVRLRVDVRNTDPAFNPPAPAAPFAMRRAWPSALDGFQRGFQLPLEHVQFVYGVGLGHHRVWSDVRGEATVEIGRDADYLVCLRMENHAAFISELWESVQVCDFNSGRVVVNVPAETTVAVTVADWRVNILAQMTDAWRYARERLGHTPRRPARILVGFLADIFGSFNGNRAFALCGGFATIQALEFEALIAGVSGIIAVTPLPPDWIAIAQIGVQAFARTALSFDIMFPGGGGVNATISRGVPTHEYGHFLTCEMAHVIDSWKLSESWIDVVNTSLGTGQAPGVENLYVIEAIADYFASQVVGGVNYFDPPNSTFATSLEYCEPGALCMDENFGGPALPAAGSFRNQLAAMSTLLFDVFDGRAGFVSDTAGPGASWEAGASATLEFARDITPPPGPQDESVALPSQAFFEVFQNWAAGANTWNHRNIVRALVRTMRDHGHSDIQICQVLALHSDTGRCEDVPGGDLDVADFPPARPLITGGPVRPVDAVRWDWRDVSVTATGFEVDFGAEGEAPTRSDVGYAREASFEADGLAPNTTYRFQVRTVNGDANSGWATDRVTTLPERVSVAPTLTPLRGGLDVEWDAVAAARYEVEWSKRGGVCGAADPCGGDARCVRGACETTRRLPAPGPGLTLEGLEAGVEHTVRIIALNGDGDAVDPSPPGVGVPLAPEVIFVSGAGDDGQSGEEGAPVRTLAAAIERARDGAQVIRIVGDIGMQQGPFTLPEGVALDGAGATLQVRGYAPAGTCRGAGFNPTRRPTFAAIQSEGETLRVSNLAIAFLTYDTDPADACLVGFSSTDGSLVLDNVFVTHTEYGAAGGARCRAAAQATGGDLEIRGSTLAGVYTLVGAANLRAVGVCMADGRSVTVTDSRLVGYEQPNFNAPFPAVAAVGLDVFAVNTVRVSRADLLASPQGTASGGEHAGGRLLALQSVFLDNVVAWSPTGGARSDGLDIGATDGLLESVRLWHVSASAGRDATLSTALPAGHEAAAVLLLDDIGTLEIVNSVLVHASGRVPNPLADALAAVDRRFAGDPSRLTLRGTVASVNQTADSTAAFLLCPPDAGEFSGIGSPFGWMGDPANHRCYFASSVAGWATDANLGFDNRPGNGGVLIDALGRANDIGGGRSARVNAAGVDLPVAMRAEVERDRNGRVRDPANPGAGAIAP